MKKFLSLFLAAVLAMSVFGLAAFAARNGDLDADNKVTAADARAILRAAVGLDKLNATQQSYADLDMDGNVTAADARLALRISVGLERTVNQYYQNEYEVLRSGNYFAEFTFFSDNVSQKFTSAVTPMTRYNSFVFADDEGLLSDAKTDVFLTLLYAEDGGLYLMDHDKKLYGDWDALLEFMASMGGDEEELDREEFITDFFPQFFSFLRPLSEAESEGTESMGGRPCKVYTFRDETGFYKAYLDGKTLVSIMVYDTKGNLVNAFGFSNVDFNVPVQYCTIPSNYEEGDVLLMMLEMLGIDPNEA